MVATSRGGRSKTNNGHGYRRYVSCCTLSWGRGRGLNNSSLEYRVFFPYLWVCSIGDIHIVMFGGQLVKFMLFCFFHCRRGSGWSAWFLHPRLNNYVLIRSCFSFIFILSLEVESYISNWWKLVGTIDLPSRLVVSPPPNMMETIGWVTFLGLNVEYSKFVSFRYPITWFGVLGFVSWYIHEVGL